MVALAVVPSWVSALHSPVVVELSPSRYCTS